MTGATLLGNDVVICVTFKLQLLVLSACTLVACGGAGSGNSGTSSARTEATRNHAGPPQDGQSSTDNDADAKKAGVAQLPMEWSDLNSDEVAACHTSGFVYDRRTSECLANMYLSTSYACDRAGIMYAFAKTGFQIDLALQSAADDGFVLDQCGESESGVQIAYLVRRNANGSYSVRELETSL